MRVALASLCATAVAVTACSSGPDPQPSASFRPDNAGFATAARPYLPNSTALKKLANQICNDLHGIEGYDGVQSNLTSLSELSTSDAATVTRLAVRYVCPDEKRELP